MRRFFVLLLNVAIAFCLFGGCRADTGAWNAGEDVSSPKAAPYLETISRADQSIFDGPGYDYSFVGTVELAGIYTIMEETRDAEGNLWGRLKSGVGWVDLTDIRSYDASDTPISANYADDRLIDSGNYHHCPVDQSEYMVQIAFRANENLKDVRLVSLELTEAGYGVAEVLAFIPELTPDKPLVADVVFYGDMSSYGIDFQDGSGSRRCYSVHISGRNGMLVLSEFTPTD